MALPPPEGLRAGDVSDFAPRGAGRARLLGVAVVAWAVAAASVALARWGGSLAGPVAAVGALLASLAAVTAGWLCRRRDVVVVLTLAEARIEETERGTLSFWRLAEPVPARLARVELEADAARAATAGELVPARVQETGFGTVLLRLGTPADGGWRLPEAAPAWPRSARLLAACAGLALAAVTLIAAAPAQPVAGTVTAAVQTPWQVGLGTLPWMVTVRLAEPGAVAERQFELPHERFLGLLPPAGRAALATPGLLPAGERAALTVRYLPLGQRVRLLRTRLGPWTSVTYDGPMR